MKPQPLDLESVRKEVFKFVVGSYADELDEFFDFTMEEIKQRIRLAIQGLLKELEEEAKINEEEILDKSYVIYRIVIPKIKKWFPLVRENETSTS